MRHLTLGALAAVLVALSGCETPPRDYSTEHPTYYNDNTREEVRDTVINILENHYDGVRPKAGDPFWVVTDFNERHDPSQLIREWAEAHVDDEDGDVGLTIYAYRQRSDRKTDFGELDTTNPAWGAKTRNHTKEKELQSEVRERLRKERVAN